MAATLQLTDGTTTLDLTAATDYVTRMAGISTPPPPHDITYAGSRGRDGTFPAFSHRGNREITLRLRIEGSSIDDLLANESAAERMLAQSTRYWRTGGKEGLKALLTVKPDGATNTVQYTVLAGAVNVGDWPDVPFRLGYRLIGASLSLTCLPFAEENADVTSTNNNQANNGINIPIVSARGEVETPAKITVGVDQAVSNPRLIIARRSAGTPTNAVWIMEADPTAAAATTAFTGYQVTEIESSANIAYSYQSAAGTTSNDHFGRWTADTGPLGSIRLARWEITSNRPDNYGMFRVWTRIKSSADDPLILYYGTAATPTLQAAASASYGLTTSWGLFDLGVIQWPDRSLPANVVVSNLVLEVACAFGAAATLDIDYLLLMPVDEAFFTCDFSAALSSGDKVVLDGMAYPAAIYVTDSGGSYKSSIVPQNREGTIPTIAPGSQHFLIYLDNAAADVRADTVDVVITYRPRYHQWRGA